MPGVVAVITPLPDMPAATSSLVHEPPPVVQLSVPVPVGQYESVPDITDGMGFTVTGNVRRQPLEMVYIIVVPPPVMPVAVPVDDPIDATEALLLVQVPPAVALV